MVNISFEDSETIHDKFKSNISFESSDKHKTFYILSNGLTYEDHELIINIDNIRDYKIIKLMNRFYKKGI